VAGGSRIAGTVAVSLELTVRASRDRTVAEILARMQQKWTDSPAGLLKRGANPLVLQNSS
jgi:hypothetical protein